MSLLFLLVAFAPTPSTAMNPIEKVISMISDLESKTIAEGEASQKTYNEFAELCEERSKQLDFEIKTGKADVADLTATIEELSAAVATAEADLKAATEIREKEASDFA